MDQISVWGIFKLALLVIVGLWIYNAIRGKKTNG